jgi:hypothetical protein
MYLNKTKAAWIIVYQRELDNGLIAGGVHAVDRIGTGVLVTPLALACLRIHAEEATCDRVVVARPQVVQAQIRIPLFAATERPNASFRLDRPQP